MFADKAVRANDPRMEAVYRNFAANLTAILELACGAGIKTVVSTVAVNIKDSAPFASRHRSTLSPANLQAWQEAVDRADEAMGLGDTARAQALWKQAVAIDPEYADTHFQLAQVLAEQDELESPRRHYLEALQWDALRFRCDARLNQIIRRCASSAPGAVVLVDAAQAMGSDGSSTAAPAGRAWFFEHVHLTWEGNYDLARLLAAGAAPLLFGTDRPPARWLSPTECAQAVGYTEFGRATMLRRMAELTARPPFAGQLGFAADRARLEREIAAADAALMASGAMPAAAEAIESASRRDPLNPFLVFQEATVNLQIGNLARALELNRRLSTLEPPSPETAAQQAFLLQQLRRTDEAEAVLLRSAATDPYYFQTYGLLGSLWAATGQLPKAREYFAALTARMPESIGARLTYAQVLEASGDGSAAEQQWRAVLRLTPDDDVALDALVQRLYARHQDGAALDLMLQAYVSNPRNFANNARLEAIFEARGDLKATVTYLQAMADSGPVKAVLHLDLALDLAKLGRRAEMLVELRRARSAAEADGDSELRQRADDLIRQQGSSSP